MLIFIAILLRSYEDARQGCCKSTLIKTAARQGCCETRKAFVRLTTELALTHFCPQMQHNRATTLRFIERLPQESYEPYEPMKFARLSSRRTCDSFATLQAHLATALRVNARQACEHRTDALLLVKIYTRYAILSWQNGRTIDVKLAYQ